MSNRNKRHYIPPRKQAEQRKQEEYALKRVESMKHEIMTLKYKYSEFHLGIFKEIFLMLIKKDIETNSFSLRNIDICLADAKTATSKYKEAVFAYRDELYDQTPMPEDLQKFEQLLIKNAALVAEGKDPFDSPEMREFLNIGPLPESNN